MWDLIVSVPDHCLSFYFATSSENNGYQQIFSTGINPCRNNLGHSLSSCLVWVFKLFFFHA